MRGCSLCLACIYTVGGGSENKVNDDDGKRRENMNFWGFQRDYRRFYFRFLILKRVKTRGTPGYVLLLEYGECKVFILLNCN